MNNMIKKVLQQMWEHKLATFVLFAGCFCLVTSNLAVGCLLISISLPLFDNDEN